MTKHSQLVGVGGWLVLLIVGLTILGPLVGFGRMAEEFEMAEKQFPSLLNNPVWHQYKQLCWTIFAATVAIGVSAGYRLWKIHVKESVRFAIIALWIIGPVAHIVPIVVIGVCFRVNANTIDKVLPSFIVSIMSAGLWTGYLIYSVRVKNTYMKDKWFQKTAEQEGSNSRNEEEPEVQFNLGRKDAMKVKDEVLRRRYAQMSVTELKGLLDEGGLTDEALVCLTEELRKRTINVTSHALASDYSSRGLDPDQMSSTHNLGQSLLAPPGHDVTDYERARELEATTPNSYNAWTHVVPALEEYAKQMGKRSHLGHDKDNAAYRDLVAKLYLAVLALYGDGLLLRGSRTEDCLTALLRSLVLFKGAFPNWIDAYSAAYIVFIEQSDDTLAILEKHQRTAEVEIDRQKTSADWQTESNVPPEVWNKKDIIKYFCITEEYFSVRYESYSFALRMSGKSSHWNEDVDEFARERKVLTEREIAIAQYDFNQAVLNRVKLRLTTDLVERDLKTTEQADPEVQFNLGRMYDMGQGVPENYTEALTWYRKAAEQGHSLAQLSLGTMYFLGRGVTQNYTEAVKWFRKAAEQGNSFAQFSLGRMHYEGKGVTQNYAKASKWFRKAAEQGDSFAQFYLGFMYSQGYGVPLRNFVQAYMWFNLAATQGHEEASKFRDYLAIQMTREQIAKAQEMTRNWKPR